MRRPHPVAAHAEDVANPRRYEFRLRGHLGDTVLCAFEGFDVTLLRDDTLLSGDVHDRAALYGLLAQIEALGLELLEMRCLSDYC